jgi:DNA-binding Lrp family transcriptional regulator
MKLDDRDERLLLALKRNARASVVELARTIGLSRSATQERLGRLEREGVISGYTVRIEKHGSQPRIRAWLLIRHTKLGSCQRSIPFLRAIPEIRSAFSIAGDLDLLVEVDCADVGDLDRVRARVETMPGVANVATHIVLSTHFENRASFDGETLSSTESVEVIARRRG